MDRKERRKTPRRPFAAAMWVRLEPGGGGRTLDMDIVNISRSGLLAQVRGESPEWLQVGAHVAITVHLLEGTDHLDLQGHVVRSDQEDGRQRFGVAFEPPGAGTVERLVTLLELIGG